MICKRFSLFLALFSLWYCKITLRSHFYDRFNAILAVFHMYMFFDILTENIFNVVFCCRKKSKILFVMAAMHSRCGYYIFIPWFLLFFLASSQWWQSGCLPYFYTWCGLSANLECRSEMDACGSLEIQDAKMTQKIAISAPSHKFVGLYLRN